MASVYREKRVVDIENTHYDYEQHKTVLDSIGRFGIVCEIDIDGLYRLLGKKAARSRGGKAVLAHGLIRFKRTV
jgi:hypothetical protein